MKKVTPLFYSNPSLKIEVLSSLPFFEKLVGGSIPPAKRGAAHYDNVHINGKPEKKIYIMFNKTTGDSLKIVALL